MGLGGKGGKQKKRTGMKENLENSIINFHAENFVMASFWHYMLNGHSYCVEGVDLPWWA